MSTPDVPQQPQGHTVLSVLRGAEDWLLRRGVEAPKRSAELLLGKVLGLGRLQLYLAHDRPLDESEREAMRGLLVRRGQGEPVAYLLGSWSFRGHELAQFFDAQFGEACVFVQSLDNVRFQPAQTKRV